MSAIGQWRTDSTICFEYRHGKAPISYQIMQWRLPKSVINVRSFHLVSLDLHNCSTNDMIGNSMLCFCTINTATYNLPKWCSTRNAICCINSNEKTWACVQKNITKRRRWRHVNEIAWRIIMPSYNNFIVLWCHSEYQFLKPVSER